MNKERPESFARSAVWRSMHENGELCPKCPTCILFPCLQKLYKLCSHPVMLQVDRHTGNPKEARKNEGNLRFAKVALTKDVLVELPGRSYYQVKGGIMDDHLRLSGKVCARTSQHVSV